MSEATVTNEAAKKVVTTNEPRSRFVAFLLNLSIGYFGLHQVYLGNKTQGWVRFGLGVASFPLMIVLIGFLIVPVLVVWQAVDFFLLQLSTKTDGEGQPLSVTKRDSAWQKGIFIAVLVVWGLYALLFIVGFSAGLFTSLQQNNYRYDFNSGGSNYQYNYRSY